MYRKSPRSGPGVLNIEKKQDKNGYGIKKVPDLPCYEPLSDSDHPYNCGKAV